LVSGVSLLQKGARLPILRIFYAALGFATLFVALGATAASGSQSLTASANGLTPLDDFIIGLGRCEGV